MPEPYRQSADASHACLLPPERTRRDRLKSTMVTVCILVTTALVGAAIVGGATMPGCSGASGD